MLSHTCTCTVGPCSNAPANEVQGHLWSLCPFGELRDPLWRAAVWISLLLDANLIANIAESYSAAISMAIIALRNAQVTRRNELEAERIADLQRSQS